MKSIWIETAGSPKKHAPLAQNLQVGAAVIGGGMAGILTAYLLGKRGMDCAVLEAAEIGSGQTKGTTAKITSQHGLLYGQLVRQFGADKARQYAHANQQAVTQYRAVVDELDIACDFIMQDAYLYSLHERDELLFEAKTAAALGLPASFAESVNLPFDTVGAVRFTNQAQFHPLKFLYAVSERVRVFEHSPVQRVDGNTLYVNGQTVTADKIVFATHYPFVNMPGYYFARMYQSRAYSIALQNAGSLDGMYIGTGESALSLRAYKDYVILCSMDHRTGENSDGGRYDSLCGTARSLYPECREVARWSAQDCVTPDDVPYIGHYCATQPDWYVATGFNKWGMSSSMAAAQILCDSITGRENANADVFSPQRFNLPTFTGVLDCSGQAVKGLSRENLTIPQETLDALPAGHGGVVLVEGEKVGVYKEPNGRTHLVDTRCPHLGCQLEWNPDEKSWDCPCHGSRFDFHGRLIDNPAQENLRGAPDGPENARPYTGVDHFDRPQAY